jgi:UDP:flavonoid glycosyltransferase YjiC (YdhE family)
MRVVIVAGGTRGDIQPMLALALELRRRGHDIVFGAPPNFEGWLTEHGLPFHTVGRDPQIFLAEHGLDIRKALGMLKDDLRREFATLADIVPGADVVIGASVTCAGLSHCEKLGVPYGYVVFSPSLLTSRSHPAPTCRHHRLPRWMNRLTWWAHRRLWNALFLGILNDERRRLGLGPVADAWDHIQSAPLMVACEPALAPLADDAPARARQIGALFLPESEPLPADLERFLAAGPAPVYLGFGSMVDGQPGRSTALLVAAIRAAGVRAVIGRGWAGLGEGAAGDDLYVAGPVPHGRLFSRVAAVVHHGGAGTTANAARVGVPQLVVPHLLDQHFWAHRVAALGLGPRPIPRARLTGPRLAAALRACGSQGRYAERARALARQIATDGVQRAADMVEGLAGQPPARLARDGVRAATS